MDIREHLAAVAPELAEWTAAAPVSEIISALKIGHAAISAARPPSTTTPSGRDGEQRVHKILSEHFTHVSASASSRDGDLTLHCGGAKIIVEVKNRAAVSAAEVEKYARDLDISGAAGGVFVSLRSKISGIPGKFYTRYDTTAAGPAPSVFVTSDDPELIIGAVNTCIKMSALIRKNDEFLADSRADAAKIAAASSALAAARCDISAAAAEVTRRLLASTALISRGESAIADIGSSVITSTAADPLADNATFLKYPPELQKNVRELAHLLAGGGVWRVSARKISCPGAAINLLAAPTVSIPRVDTLIATAAAELGRDFGVAGDEFVLTIGPATTGWVRSYLAGRDSPKT